MSKPTLDAPLSWAQTRELMRRDFARYRPLMGEHVSLPKKIFWLLLPATLGLLAYRTYRYAYLRGWRNLANLMFLINRYVTGMDIPPSTSIGGGCLLGHGEVVLCGRIGENFTMMGHGGVGGGFNDDDVGAGPGLPVLGDNIVMAVRSIVLGAVRIGDGARLGPACTVMRDVPPGAVVAAAPSRVMPVPQAGNSAGGAD
ncbi:MAG: hypothetical protein JSS56_20590 [Proteobacteria bacterium]|nr:hypothetical protein [Pseudomonadota bacterium]